MPLVIILVEAGLTLRARRLQNELSERGFQSQGLVRVPVGMIRRLRPRETAAEAASRLDLARALRLARISGLERVLVLSDTCAINENIREVLEAVSLPDDFLYVQLGAYHVERPEIIGPAVVKTNVSLGFHAVLFNMRGYKYLIPSLIGSTKKGIRYPLNLARLQTAYPCYAVFPNLAWPESGTDAKRYLPWGSQAAQTRAMVGFFGDYLETPVFTPTRNIAMRFRTGLRESIQVEKLLASEAKIPLRLSPICKLGTPWKIAFLFLTRSAHLNEEVWNEYFAKAPSMAYSVLSHPKEDTVADDGLIGAHIIKARVDTQWGRIGLVRAQLALLQQALLDSHNQFFVFASESCVPITPFRRLWQQCKYDGRSIAPFAPWNAVVQKDPGVIRRMDCARSIPIDLWQFHSQWLMLNREAAELVCSEDLTELFEDSFAADECYFGTVLNLKGYPLGSHVNRRELTWKQWPKAVSAHPIAFDTVTRKTVGMLLSSGCFFARKFTRASNIKKWGLHTE